MEQKPSAAVSTAPPVVTTKVTTEQKAAKKKEKVATSVAGVAVKQPVLKESVVPKEPSVVVDFKKCKEGVQGKVALPEDASFKINDARTIAVHGLFVASINGIIGTEKLDKPLIIPRQSVLNSFCIINKLTPINCKKENKTENATVSTYGIVPVFNDTFASGDLNNYKLFGFLRHPILVSKNWIAVKYGTYFVVLNPIMYASFTADKLTEDVTVKLIGEIKKLA